MTKRELATLYTMILPGIYMREGAAITPLGKARALFLWGDSTGDTGCGELGKGAGVVLSGFSAAAVWGVKWIRDDDPAECIRPGHRRLRRCGWAVIHRDRVDPRDVRRRHGMLVTCPVRTAYDTARRCDLGRAVEVLDAWFQTGRLGREELSDYIERNPARRNVRQLRRALAMSDAGAESLWETRLRIILVEAGFPRPETQVSVHADAGAPWPGRFIGRADMGWRCWRVLVDYEGSGHNEDGQVSKDIKRGNRLAACGWRWIRVREDQLSGDSLQELLHQIRDALRAGGAPDSVLPSAGDLDAFVRREDLRRGGHRGPESGRERS